jgi:hypothetical protein
MRSVGTGGVTIVTIITLIFSTYFGSNHKPQTRLVGTEVEQTVEQCAPLAPCPAFRTIFRFEIRP